MHEGEWKFEWEGDIIFNNDIFENSYKFDDFLKFNTSNGYAMINFRHYNTYPKIRVQNHRRYQNLFGKGHEAEKNHLKKK